MFGILQYKNKFNIEDLVNLNNNLSLGNVWYKSKILLSYSNNSNYTDNKVHFQEELVILFKGRIDNKDNLFNYLDIKKDNYSIKDSTIIYFAYKKWGRDCVNYIIGDWAFLIWNNNSEELLIARDHHGISSIYYYYDSDFIVFSTSLETILSLNLFVPQPNTNKIKKLLFGINEHGNTTCYKNINRLPPAHLLTTGMNSNLSIKRYWFLEDVKSITYKNESDYYDHFNEVFQQAIKCRIDEKGKNGSLLSGGLDSTSITANAAKMLGQKKIYSFTSVPKYNYKNNIRSNQNGNETKNVKLLVKKYPNIIPIFSNSDNNPVEAVKRMLLIHNEPVFAVNNHYWITDLMSLAKSNGISSLFIGQGGNHTISWPPIIDDKVIRNQNAILKIIKKTSLYSHLKLNKDINQSILASKSVFDSDFKKDLLQHRSLHMYRDTSYKLSNEYRMLLISPGSSKMGAILNQLGNAYGIVLKDPSLDKRIFEYCTAIPEHTYMNNNNYRLLIRKAMVGILPETILENKYRGVQSADLPERLIYHKESLYDELNDLSTNSSITSIIDIDMMKKIASNILAGKYERNTLPYCLILLSGIMTGNFLKQFK